MRTGGDNLKKRHHSKIVKMDGHRISLTGLALGSVKQLIENVQMLNF